MDELERHALMGDAEAQKECTEKGIVLPCPFCTGTGIDQGVVSSGILKGSYYFQREDCGCEITVNASEHLLSTWNTRAAPPIGRRGECKHQFTGDSDTCFSGIDDEFCSGFEPKQS